MTFEANKSGQGATTASPPPRAGARDGSHVRGVLPALVLAVLVAAAVWLWRLQVAVDRQAGAHERSVLVVELAERAERTIGAEMKRAAALAKVAMTAPGDRGAFFDAVQREIGPEAVTPQRAVAWFSKDWIIGAVRADAGEPVLIPSRDLIRLPQWETALARSRDEREPRVAEVAVRDGRAEFLFVAPAISGEGTAAAYLGGVASRLDVTRALANVVRHGDRAGYDLDFSDGPVRLVEHGRRIDDDDPNSDARAVRVADRYFRLRLRPMEANLARESGRSALWVLWVGLTFAVALSWAVGHVLRRRWEAVQEAGRQLEAMRLVSRAAGVISGTPGAAKEALHRLAASARELLGMKIVTVLVLDEGANSVEVVARDGDGDPNPRSSYSLDEARATRECIRTGELIVVEDVETDARVHRPVMRGHGVRAAMFVPLVVERQVIGAMFMGHERPRVFGEPERQLAGVLASQAAVALANLRLYEQKDAALAVQKEMTRRHDALYQIASEIYRSADLGQSLQRLADAAPALMGVDLCVVSMRTGAAQTRIAAISGEEYAGLKGEETLCVNSNFARVWESKRLHVIEDAENDPTVHPAYRHRLHIGSIMYLPLVGGRDEAIGTVVLIRHRRAPFSQEQLELAEVLAARAAAAIETARLHEAARQSAQTQEMLLRELNHRVKNNLASIVALLAMDRPPTMPADAQAWLNRVSERIATMARTHELFVGGTDRVELRELVNKLLPALSLIRPSGVEIRAELDHVEVELGTERAVSLAMVLNELCWNALEHGMGENGVLRIRGYGLNGKRLAIEVEDDGRGGGADGSAVGAPARGGGLAGGANGRGTGLRLVEGLVSRELRGRFVMERSAAGGTLARVEIPLEEGEAGRLSL